MRNYRELQIWQKAMFLVTKTYVTTRSFPKEEIFGLTSQLRRCSVSILSNIAEGSGRDSNKEFSRFINIALGSLSEFKRRLK